MTSWQTSGSMQAEPLLAEWPAQSVIVDKGFDSHAIVEAIERPVRKL